MTNCIRQFKAEVFGTPVLGGRVAEEISIVKGFIMASIYVVVFSPFRGIIIKEDTDPEKIWRILNIADNLVYLGIFLALFFCLRFIKQDKPRIVVNFIFQIVLAFGNLEISLQMKADHRSCIEMYTPK